MISRRALCLGASQLAFLGVAAAGIGRAVAAAPRRTIASFGARGDGRADDSDAVDAAIRSSVPLDWQDRTYRVTRRVGPFRGSLANLDWTSSGARIVLDPRSDPQPAVLEVRLAPGGFHSIAGSGLAIDASFKASMGAYFNQPEADRHGIFESDRLAVSNIRSDAKGASASGIRIRGGFGRVALRHPAVRNVILARGSGKPGSAGVNGIFVTRADPRISDSAPLFVHLIEPLIENVTSEDPDYTMDQDGLVMFGRMHTDPEREYDECLVEGGLWRNCWGRDIKVQMGGGRVVGGRFEHFTAPRSGTAGSSIAFLWGPGTVERVSHHYRGVSPVELVAHAAGRHGDPRAAIYRQSTYEIHDAAAQSIMRTYARRSDFPPVVMEEITGVGRADFALSVHLPSRTAEVRLRSVAGTFLKALAEATVAKGIEPGQLIARAEDCANYGARVPFVASRLPRGTAGPRISAVNNTGFLPPG